MSSLPQLPVADCPQLPVAEPTSEDELQLIKLDFRGGISANAAQRRWSPRRREMCTTVHSKCNSQQTADGANQEMESQKGSFAKMVDRPHATAHPILPPDHLQKMPVVASNRDDSETTPSSSRISGHRDSLPQTLQPHHFHNMPVVASNRNDSETPPEAAMDDRDPQQRPNAGVQRRA